MGMNHRSGFFCMWGEGRVSEHKPQEWTTLYVWVWGMSISHRSGYLYIGGAEKCDKLWPGEIRAAWLAIWTFS